MSHKPTVVSPQASPARPTSTFSLQRSAFPQVLINMAMTADGKIATSNRVVSSFGSRRDHEHLLELRATSDAVMSGARTVDSARINMGPGGKRYQRLRLKRGLSEFNLRVVVSGSGSVDINAEVFKHRFSPVIVLTTERMPASTRRGLREMGVIVKICGSRQISFRSALRWLHRDWNVNRLLCEGGGELNDALFRAGLVDELHLTICPKLFGGRNAPTITEGIGFQKLADSTRLSLKSSRRVGDELFLVFGRADAPSH
ncbi:MAG TPA: dihydrofolate reductase family protein [Verrucomicrobiota bacterium]|nr:dihydrofolate reductase family protein [Verrucomicrobiota bacterium]